MASILLPSRVALITGAASGIGLAMSKICVNHGMKLAMVDNQKDLLARAKESFGAKSDVETYEVDVAKIEQWKGLKESVEKRFGGVDFLMLNAGVGGEGDWNSIEYFRRIIEINLFGYINGITTFLESVRSRPHPTAIVLTGSKQGITNPPGNPAYNASKSAVKTLAEQLHYDLSSTTTSVHLLVPGWAFTGLSGGAPGSTKEKPAGAWSGDQVAEFLEQKMNEGQFWVLCPDNDVSEELDKKRMLWSAGDAVYRRKPLSRWREEYKEEAKTWMDKQSF